MTTEIPAPHIPDQLGELTDTWGRKHAAITEIDGEIARIEPAMAELQQRLAELNHRHADLGRQRTAAVEQAKFARDVVEYGCKLAGVPMPPMPPTGPLTPALDGPPPAVHAPAVPAAAEPVPPFGPDDAEARAKAEAFQALQNLKPIGLPVAGQATSETVTDPAPPAPQDTGGDQPTEGGFRPDQGDAEPRRRRGGRRAQ